MPAYTSFIFDDDVHKSYRVEKIVSHHLIFLLIVSVIGFKRNFITTANIRLLYGKRMWNKIKFVSHIDKFDFDALIAIY